MSTNLPTKKVQESITKAKNFVGGFGQHITDYALTNYNHDAFLKSAVLCILESEDLQKCLNTPEGQLSLYHALGKAATNGLSLNPQMGEAALIAYGGKVEYQAMKNGMITLAMRSGKVEFITSDIVYENDTFKIEKKPTGDEYYFCPALRDRGDIMGFFAAIRMKDGTCHVYWIDKPNMEKHRDKYSKGLYDKTSGKAIERHAWHKSFEGMGIKTVLKMLLRGVVISQELTQAVGADDIGEFGEEIITDIEVMPSPKEAGASANDVKAKLEETQPEESPESEGGKKPDLF